MSSTLAVKQFLLGATAILKAGQSAPQGIDSVAMSEADAPVIKDLGNDLYVAYVVDMDDSLVYVQNHHLAGTTLTPDGLHELGLHNLAERAAGKARMQQHGEAHAVLVDGLFEASLMLLDDLWDQTLASLAPNGFVVAAPARDVLAFCDAQSEEGIKGLRNMADKVFESGDHLVTKDLYRREGGAWIKY